MTTTDTPVAEAAPVEALAHAMAQSAHQHASATPEDAPPQQAKLPIPRPPFDIAAAWVRIKEARDVCRDLARKYTQLHDATKKMKAKLDDAEGALKQILDRVEQSATGSMRRWPPAEPADA